MARGTDAEGVEGLSVGTGSPQLLGRLLPRDEL